MIKLLLVEDDANLCYIIRGGLEDMIGGRPILPLYHTILLWCVGSREFVLDAFLLKILFHLQILELGPIVASYLFSP